ncbi:MAG: LPS export ABC transporter periplasmic protein LptC [Candidatus Eisenbacteria bacterium]|nr:LPS export ABC transporter periplasmic protein LptC [Candidatus Eisenbacteria bacterium]
MVLRRMALGASLVLAFLAAACQHSEPTGRERPAAMPDQEIQGFTLTQTQEGRKVWVLKAREALVFEASDRVDASGVRVDFYGSEAELRSTLTAATGVIMRRTNAIEVNGSVVVTAADGTVLTTDRLAWDERTGKIRSDRPVRVTKGNDVMTGSGMEADPDLRNLKVKDFKAYVRTPEGELVEDR